MLFADIIGQETVKQRLRQSVVEGRMPHAQLFCGIEGVGKLPLALAYAQYACCKHRTATDSCGVCPSCVQFAKLAHPDLHLVFPIVKNESKKRTICDHFLPEFRAAVIDNPYLTLNRWMACVDAGKQGVIYAGEGDEIIRKLSLKTYESDYKVMIIWHPEKMHENCANHLLKILEEPPAQTLFLLVTDAPDSLLGTIRSRVQRVPVSPLSDGELVAAAVQKTTIDHDHLSLLARMAQGSWSHLTELLDRDDEQRRCFDWFVRMMRYAWSLGVKDIMQWSTELKAAGRESVKAYFRYAQRMLRENFVLRLQQPGISYMDADEKAFAEKFAPFINERNVLLIMDELTTAEAQIEQNGNMDIVLLDMCVRLYRLLRKIEK